MEIERLSYKKIRLRNVEIKIVIYDNFSNIERVEILYLNIICDKDVNSDNYTQSIRAYHKHLILFSNKFRIKIKYINVFQSTKLTWKDDNLGKDLKITYNDLFIIKMSDVYYHKWKIRERDRIINNLLWE